MVPESALRPARPAAPQDAALVRCRVTWHGLSLRLERGGGVSARLLHFPAGNAATWWRHQAHRIIEAGPGASSPAAARWPAPGARASRARTRVVVSGKRPNQESGFRCHRAPSGFAGAATTSPICFQPVMKGHRGRLEPVGDSVPARPARGMRPRSGHGWQPACRRPCSPFGPWPVP